MSTPIECHEIHANGLTVNVATAGRGPVVVLLHGFPHTWRVWEKVMPQLARSHTVVAPDLRGLGGTERPEQGYDALSITADVLGVMDALDVDTADVVGIDLGTPPAFLTALTHPDRVRRLVVMESLVGPLPGAEAFLAHGAPWWFGFHSVPGLAETVLVGHERDYLDFFLAAGTMSRGVDPDFREAVIRAYEGADAMRAAFEYYRALPTSGEQVRAAVACERLTVPTMTIGAFPVGDATFRQLQPIADTLVGHVIADCGHIIPQDRPDELLGLLVPFLA